MSSRKNRSRFESTARVLRSRCERPVMTLISQLGSSGRLAFDLGSIKSSHRTGRRIRHDDDWVFAWPLDERVHTSRAGARGPITEFQPLRGWNMESSTSLHSSEQSFRTPPVVRSVHDLSRLRRAAGLYLLPVSAVPETRTSSLPENHDGCPSLIR